MGSILIENGAVVTVNDNGEVFDPGYVFIEDDLITAVGVGQAPPNYKRADTVIDASLMAVMPGMVNAHTHLFQTFLRGLADDKPLLDWLKAAIWPVAQSMKEEEAYVAAMVGLIENHPSLMETQEKIISETERLRNQWEVSGNGRTRVEYAPLIPWGCSDDTMLRSHKISQGWNSGTHIHVAETKTEVDMNLQLRGNRHIEWLNELGVLGPSMQLVHSVWLTDEELELIAKYKSIVVHCPVSNMYLASGVARVPEMLKMGITVALASDGPGSNNNQDMFAVMKATALLHKVNTLNAMVLLPEDVLQMACRGGSVAFGQPELIGSLEVGKKADLILVDLDTPLAMPVHKVPSALIYNAGSRDVDTVIVDGRILMKGKEILVVDEKSILAQARKVCGDLFARAGVKPS
jgi:5-methylthioadenosine/S-adenosylhomocysteine deaminase